MRFVRFHSIGCMDMDLRVDTISNQLIGEIGDREDEKNRQISSSQLTPPLIQDWTAKFNDSNNSVLLISFICR